MHKTYRDCGCLSQSDGTVVLCETHQSLARQLAEMDDDTVKRITRELEDAQALLAPDRTDQP